MATLIVTFTPAFANVYGAQAGNIAGGRGARSESITMPDTSTLAAIAGDAAVELTADVDCWVAIGEAPDPAAATDGPREAHFLKANMPYQYHVAVDDRVAVEAAS